MRNVAVRNLVTHLHQFRHPFPTRSDRSQKKHALDQSHSRPGVTNGEDFLRPTARSHHFRAVSSHGPITRIAR